MKAGLDRARSLAVPQTEAAPAGSLAAGEVKHYEEVGFGLRQAQIVAHDVRRNQSRGWQISRQCQQLSPLSPAGKSERPDRDRSSAAVEAGFPEGGWAFAVSLHCPSAWVILASIRAA